MVPRWTENLADVQKLADLPDFLAEWGFKNVRVTLTGGASLEGIFMPGAAGNNAGEGGRWAYYATVALRMPNEDVEIDFLDVAHIQPA